VSSSNVAIERLLKMRVLSPAPSSPTPGISRICLGSSDTTAMISFRTHRREVGQISQIELRFWQNVLLGAVAEPVQAGKFPNPTGLRQFLCRSKGEIWDRGWEN
jgi:hypothetical protein